MGYEDPKKAKARYWSNPEKYRARAREQMREAFRRNPEKRRQTQRNWRERNPDKLAVYNERRRQRRLDNPDRIRAQQRRARNPLKARESIRDWRERNLDYARRQGRKNYQRLRDIPAPNSGKSWTPAEDATVLRDDITLIEMAYMLGRSVGAVHARRNGNKPNGRGKGHNRLKTHCKNGHEFTEENTWIEKTGARHCRTCHRIRQGVKNPQEFAPRDRTHCPAGHPYNAENTRYTADGHRQCRVCDRERATARRERRRTPGEAAA